jgi:hypothetical protein
MTPTREQLELAAKAAGIVIEDWNDANSPMYRGARGDWHVWRPATDKSDSRDLEVACEIELRYGRLGVWATAKQGTIASEVQYYEDHNNDKGLATCAAVFLCVVEIGRAM